MKDYITEHPAVYDYCMKTRSKVMRTTRTKKMSTPSLMWWSGRQTNLVATNVAFAISEMSNHATAQSGGLKDKKTPSARNAHKYGNMMMIPTAIIKSRKTSRQHPKKHE